MDLGAGVIGRWWGAFRVAFWIALQEEAAYHTRDIRIKVTVDADEAMATVQELQTQIEVLFASADYAAISAGKLH